jgi:hypothetical protein
MRLKCLACEALARIVYLCAAHSPHIVDVELFRIGLHREPENLRTLLQQKVDESSTQDYDAVIMAYGLCGKATSGLVAQHIPLVIPRAHDCITLFLGDRQRYAAEFSAHPGTYWYALDYAERNDGSMGLGTDGDQQTQATYEEYVAKYGKDNADYLMEVMGGWTSHYDRAAFIELGVGDSTAVQDRTEREANERGWSYERLEGDLVLIRRLLEGDWEDDFLILPPGQQVAMTHDGSVLGCMTPTDDCQIERSAK